MQTESVKRAKLRLVTFLITWAVLAASRAVTGATMAQGVVAPIPPIPMPLSPDPAALPEWAAESAKELVAAGLVSASAESPAAPTRGDFMALAVACAGRSTDGWVQSLRRESVIVGGPDGSLRLDDPITRGEAAAFLVKLLQVEPEGAALGLYLEDAPPAGPAPADIGGHWSATYFL
ncbi:MAG: S-layer homology domain-containing protein, partial [Bacillota bacterium]